MRKFYNASRGPVSFMSSDGQVLVVAPKKWIELEDSAGVSESLLSLINQKKLIPSKAKSAPAIDPVPVPAPSPAEKPIDPPLPPSPPEKSVEEKVEEPAPTKRRRGKAVQEDSSDTSAESTVESADNAASPDVASPEGDNSEETK